MGIIDDCGEAYKDACPCLHEADTFRNSTKIGLGILLLLAIPIQSAGMFTSNWVVNETCSDIGLIYTRCEDATVRGSKALHTTAYGMQVVSYIILLGASVVFIGLWCCLCRKAEERAGKRGGGGIVRFCFPFFLPTATFFSGLFNFISCMIVRQLASDQHYEFGYSYYLCLTTAVVMSLMSLSSVIGYFIHAYACRCVAGDSK